VTINLGVIGRSSPWVERTWSATEVMLYALGVGAGQDPTQELEFTTENSSGVALQVLPTFALVLSGAPIDDLGDFDPAMRVHGEQRLELHRPIPVEGRARTRTVCSAIWDKGSGALFEFDSTLEDAATGELIATSRMGSFVRGEGGFGGRRGAPAALRPRPERPPDHRVTYDTRAEQALVYRLTGDRAPSHSDPVVARRGGFARPILHGLCTYGFVGRALLHSVCGSQPARFTSMSARFKAPVTPGDTLIVSIWTSPDGAVFEARNQGGAVVLDRGEATLG
jgi:acyl dehydratase